MDVLSQPSAIATHKSEISRLEEEQFSNKEGWDTIIESPVKPQALKEKETTTSSSMSTFTESLSVTSDADPSQSTYFSTGAFAVEEKEQEDESPRYDGCENTTKIYPRSCLKVKSQRASVGQSFGSTRQKPPAADKHAVRFATITILSHEICLGDSPSVSNGPPIQIDWIPFDTATFDLNDFEETKPPARLRPEMQLPAYVRENMLMRAGFSRPELKAASQEAQQLQNRIWKSSRDADRWWNVLRRKVFRRNGEKHTDRVLISKANAK